MNGRTPGGDGRGRGLSSLVAEILIVLVAVSAAVILYVYMAANAPSSSHTPSTCIERLEAVKVNLTGVYAWVRVEGKGCILNVSTGYLTTLSGRLASRLEPLWPSLAGGGAGLVRLLPLTLVGPGDYLLEVVLQGGVKAAARLLVTGDVAEATIARGQPAELNKTIVRQHYNVSITVTETPAGNYNVSVSVCPHQGVTMTYVRGEIYNSTHQPPKWIGRYYVYVDTYTPYTYPLCSLWYWEPIAPDEFPVTVLVLVDYRS